MEDVITPISKRKTYIYIIIVLAWLFLAVFAGMQGGGWLASYFVLSIYYGILVLGSKQTGVFEFLKTTKWRLFVILCVALIPLVVVGLVISQERFVYYWDYSSYLFYTVNISESFSKISLNDAISQLFRSINYDEYNVLISYVVAIPLKILGQSYLAFEMLTAGMFLFPAIIFISYLLEKLQAQFLQYNVPALHICIIVALFPSFTYVVLLGYVDAIGLPLMALAFLYERRIRLAPKFPFRYTPPLALVLVLLLLLRRWFAAFILSYVLFLAIEAIIGLLFAKGGNERFIIFERYFLTFLFVGFFSALFLIIFARGLLSTLLFNRYTVSYAGWQTLDILQNWKGFIRYFGVGILLLYFIEIMRELSNIKKDGCAWGIATLPGIIVSAMYFWMLADMPEHVYYIFCIQLCVCAGMSAIWLSKLLIKKIQNKISVNVALSAFSLFFVFNFLIMNGVGDIKNYNIGLFTGNRYVARVRTDMDELYRLHSYLDDITDNLGNDLVYVAASGEVLNDDILRRLRAPDYSMPYTLLSTSHADLVSGFNTDFFDASVVVITDPIQLHLAPRTQLVQEYIVNGILSKKDVFADQYAEGETFVLENGVVAKTYIHKNYYTNDDVQAVENYFEGYYSAYPELFKNRFEEYKNRVFPCSVGELRETVFSPEGKLRSNFTTTDGHLISTGQDTLIFGPYEEISEGTYDVTFYYTVHPDINPGLTIGYIDVNINVENLKQEDFNYVSVPVYAQESNVSLQWQVDREFPNAEVRMTVLTPGIEFVKLEIKKINS